MSAPPSHISRVKRGVPVSADSVRTALAQALRRRDDGARRDVVWRAPGRSAEVVPARQEHGALTIVDAVVTLAAMAVPMDEWGIDVCLTGGPEGAVVHSWRVALRFQMRPGRRSKRTRSAPALVLTRFAHSVLGRTSVSLHGAGAGRPALHEALRLVAEETLPRRFRRHEVSSLAMQAGLEAMGLTLFAPKDVRLNSVLAITLPDGVDSARLREHMTKAFRSGDQRRVRAEHRACRTDGRAVPLAQSLQDAVRARPELLQSGRQTRCRGGMSALEQGLTDDQDYFLD